MRHIIKTIFFFLIILVLSCRDTPNDSGQNQSQGRDTVYIEITGVDQLAAARRLLGIPEPQGLRVAAGRVWLRWISGDSIAANGIALLSQDTTGMAAGGPGKQVIVDDIAMSEWFLMVARDSLNLAQYSDTLRLSNDTLYISGQNYVLLSDYLDNTDAQTLSFSNPNLSISGGNSVDLSALSGGSFDSFYFNDGSTVSEITDGDTLTHIAASTVYSVVGTISTGVQDMIDSFGIAAVYSTSAGVVTRASTASSSTLHQYYLDFNSPTRYYYGPSVITINAIFSYTAGQTYYLQDNGRLSNSADNDGDAQDFDSAVLYVIASLGASNYLVALSDPRHFIN